MEIREKMKRIFSYGYVCDHCLGRQFAKLLSGFSNDERGRALRLFFAMDADASGCSEKSIHANLGGFSFRNCKTAFVERSEDIKCSVCGGFFNEIDEWVSLALREAKGKEFSSFSVGTSLSGDLLSREESLWESAGVEYCEPIKSEINREVGKRLEKKLGIKADLANPQASFLLDIEKKSVGMEINPAFIYGEYQKLARGIPQTRWPSGKYKTSVEQIIAKPFVKAMKGSGHKLHGLGREDIDARCLGWRPFVLEITSPKKRRVSLDSMRKYVSISGKVRIRGLRISSMNEVREIKESRAMKKYQVIVECEKEFGIKELSKLKSLVGEIRQRTPERVEHRRANRIRSRRVIAISVSKKGNKRLMLTVTGDAGLYIKELVSGDNGRTRPSVSEVLGCRCIPRELDVLEIIKPGKKQAFKI